MTGQGWLDHQWGNFATNAASWHWNWFACQFDDGSDLMLYQFISPSGRPTGVQSGTFVSARGAVTHPTRYQVIPLRPDVHPPGATGTYPLRWQLEVPLAHADITLDARARHQFISNQYIPGFWEGAAAITRGGLGDCIVESTRETTSGFSVRGLLTPRDRGDQLVIDRLPAGRHAVLEPRAADQPQPT